MFRFTQGAAAVILSAALAMAQPALTTIQDTLYLADGSRFSGTVYIAWNSFDAGDTSNIATSNIALPVVNGALRVRLVPTTTASAGAQYAVRYNSRGRNDFTETWAVPPSTVTLRVRDVRVTTGTVVGPPPVVSPVQIPDVVGLQNELSLRTSKGVGFGIGRAAVINESGQIDAAVGSPSDCLRVDGTTFSCSNLTFVDNELPTGSINGINATFSLTNAPSPVASLNLYRNGILMTAGVDYQLTGTSVVFFSTSTPQLGDILRASYRH